MTLEFRSEDPKLAAFDDELKKIHIRGQWTAESNLKAVMDGPQRTGSAYVWRYNDVLAAMEKARSEFPTSYNLRRSLMFHNPDLDMYTTQNIGMGIQEIEPGEIAWPHRHTATAMRFVVEGDKQLATVIDGKPQMMEDYDLIITPKWTWHGHHNQSDHPVRWVDILDVPTVWRMNQVFYQDSDETELVDHIPSAESRNPGPERSKKASPVYRFAWKDIEPRLRAMAAKNESDPYDGVMYRYPHPETGGPILATLDCRAHLIRPGEKTKAKRRASSAVFFCVSGQGQIVVDGKAHDYGKHDCIAVPHWKMMNFVNTSNSEDAVLFSVSDEPMLKALELYEERFS